jgi:hypothetical protein
MIILKDQTIQERDFSPEVNKLMRAVKDDGEGDPIKTLQSFDYVIGQIIFKLNSWDIGTDGRRDPWYFTEVARDLQQFRNKLIQRIKSTKN